MFAFVFILTLALMPSTPAGAQSPAPSAPAPASNAPAVSPVPTVPSVPQPPAPNAPTPLAPATPPPVAPATPPVLASPNGANAAQARTLTLAQVVNIAVNSNTSVILARQRLQQAQELINQVNAQGKPQGAVDLADTYTDYRTTTAALPVTEVTNPTLPGGATIPSITDLAGGVSTGFNSATSAATGASSAGTATTGTIGGIGTGSSTTGSNGLDTTLPGSTAPPTLGSPAAPSTDSSGSSTGVSGDATSPGGGAGTGASGGSGAGVSAPSTGTGGGASGAASPQARLAPLPDIIQQFVTASDTADPAQAAPSPDRAADRPAAARTEQPQQTTTAPTPTSGAPSAAAVGNKNNFGGRLALSQYIDAFGLLANARDVEVATRDFYALDLIRTENEAALAAKNLYFDVLLAEANLATQQEQVADATEALRIAQARLSQGIAARFDVLTAQTTLANAQEALSSAQDQAALAEADLDFLLGVPSTAPVTLQEPPLPPLDETVNVPATTRTALARRPETIQAQKNIAIAQRLIRFAEGTLTPVVGLVGVAGYNSTAIPTQPAQTLAVTAQVDIPFDDGGATRSRVRSARVALASQVVTRNQLQLSVALEVQTAALNITDAQTRTRTATTALVAAQEEVRVANVRYQNGLGTFLDVTNALAQLSQARTNLANAEFGYQTSLAALVRAVGGR